MARLEPDTRLAVAADYARTLHASPERVWENVLDWEHLPWLHARAFESAECIESGPWGWRARFAGIGGGEPSTITLSVDREQSRYVVRTGAEQGSGAPAQSEIWTTLTPEAAERTRVDVEFRVPPQAEDALRGIGAMYVSLYTMLWDEDEEMILERAARLAEESHPPADTGVDLGSPDALRTRLPLDIVFEGRRFRVVEREGGFFVHAAVCPHMLGPLFAVDDAPDQLECPWHGYVFDTETGRSCDGHRLRLPAAPRVDVDSAPGRCTLVATEG